MNRQISEAKIHERIQHKNIVSVLGTAPMGICSFVIILEYIRCGDMNSFLMLDSGILIPWKIRARFSIELAEALDYLHYHDPKRSFIYGGLKPENVLLGEKQHKISRFWSNSNRKTDRSDFINNWERKYSAHCILHSQGLREKIFQGYEGQYRAPKSY